MRLRAVICRGLLLAAGCGLGLGGEAQGLPATAPTVPGALPPVAPPGAQVVAVKPVAAKPVAEIKRARVEYAGRTLEIEADNSSLNGILREVSRVTGMKITGGVAEDQVYGTYGPGTAGAVLEKLLEGTETNLLLILDRNQQPSELVLTQRNGGPTPPGPNSGRYEGRGEDVDTPPQLAHHTPAPGGNPAPRPPNEAPVQESPEAPARPAQAGTTTEQSPNGVKTPQQIYEQLLQLQQQKQQTSPH